MFPACLLCARLGSSKHMFTCWLAFSLLPGFICSHRALLYCVLYSELFLGRVGSEVSRRAAFKTVGWLWGTGQSGFPSYLCRFTNYSGKNCVYDFSLLQSVLESGRNLL